MTLPGGMDDTVTPVSLVPKLDTSSCAAAPYDTSGTAHADLLRRLSQYHQPLTVPMTLVMPPTMPPTIAPTLVFFLGGRTWFDKPVSAGSAPAKDESTGKVGSRAPVKEGSAGTDRPGPVGAKPPPKEAVDCVIGVMLVSLPVESG